MPGYFLAGEDSHNEKLVRTQNDLKRQQEQLFNSVQQLHIQNAMLVQSVKKLEHLCEAQHEQLRAISSTLDQHVEYSSWAFKHLERPRTVYYLPFGLSRR